MFFGCALLFHHLCSNDYSSNAAPSFHISSYFSIKPYCKIAIIKIKGIKKIESLAKEILFPIF